MSASHPADPREGPSAVESLAREVVRVNGYSPALLLVGDRLFNATTAADAAQWKHVADWLLDHPEVAHAR